MELVSAVVDLRFYRKVVAQPVGRTWRTLRHLMLLVVIATTAATIAFAIGTSRLLDRLERHVDRLPTITLRDGEASADVPQPWLLELGRRSDGGRVVLIIDTTGTWSDFAPGDQGLFLARRHLLVRLEGRGGEATRAIPLRWFGNRTIGPQLFRAWIARARWLLPTLFAIVMLVYACLAKCAHALLLTLVALIAAQGRRRPLEFGALFSLSVYALTPAILYAAARRLLGMALLGSWGWSIALYWAAAIGYTVIAVRSLPDGTDDDAIAK